MRDVRNQGVLLEGVNATSTDLLDLSFTLLDGAGIMPYYFYMCDMIPNAEHWRVPLAKAQELQHAIMGYLPGFATPRIVCDVPFVGKRWVHQVHTYDQVLGISEWTKNYRTGIEFDDPERPDPQLPLLRPDPHPARGGPALVGPACRRGPQLSVELGSTPLSATGPAGPRTGTDSTTVVRVDTPAMARISLSRASRATGDATRTLRM